MIPPQALNAIGLALAKGAAWGVAQLVSRGIDGGFDVEIRRLSKLDEPSLLVEIARRDDAAAALVPRAEAIRRGRTVVDRLLPKARALICPHRDTLLKVTDSPEVAVIGAVAGYLIGGVPGALVKPVATVVVKRGLPLLCGDQVRISPRR
jgi:hypothetical protein